MRTRRKALPSYRHHKASGQAVVTLSGRDYYLGVHGTPESHARYDEVLAEWLAGGRPTPTSVVNGRRRAASALAADAAAWASDLTVAELIVRYLAWVDRYYRRSDGTVTAEPKNIRLSLRPLRKLLPHARAAEVGPLALKAVRQVMIDAKLCRREINKRIGRIVRCFKWGASEELVPVGVYEALRTVEGLKEGRSEAVESEPVKPVPDAVVEATLPHLSPGVAAMVRLMRLTGMRVGEVALMRGRDIGDLRDDGTRTFMPVRHKMSYRKTGRIVYLGPRAWAVLEPHLLADAEAWIFSPAREMAWYAAERRKARATPLRPSDLRSRRKANPKVAPGAVYEARTFFYALRRGIDRANRERAKAGLPPLPHWHAHQLRHTAATEMRRELSLDAARSVLGHRSPDVTAIYAERDEQAAAEAMRRLG